MSLAYERGHRSPNSETAIASLAYQAELEQGVLASATQERAPLVLFAGVELNLSLVAASACLRYLSMLPSQSSRYALCVMHARLGSAV